MRIIRIFAISTFKTIIMKLRLQIPSDIGDVLTREELKRVFGGVFMKKVLFLLMLLCPLMTMRAQTQGQVQVMGKWDGVGTVYAPTDLDEAAGFIGGLAAWEKYVKSVMTYPATAKKKKIQGRVVLEFVVDASGNISKITLNHLTDPDLDAEAVRILETSSGKKWWKPAKKDGKAVNSLMSIPVTFRL